MGIPVRLAKTENFYLVAEALFDQKTLVMKPVGVIDESFPIQDLYDYMTKIEDSVATVALNLSMIERMNSEGTKHWVKFLKRIQSRIDCIISEVSEAFLEQAIVLPEVLGKKGTEVSSILAPYYCAQCNERLTQLWRVPELKIQEDQFEIPKAVCAKCSKSVEFDGDDGQYLRVLHRHCTKKGASSKASRTKA